MIIIRSEGYFAAGSFLEKKGRNIKSPDCRTLSSSICRKLKKEKRRNKKWGEETKNSFTPADKLLSARCRLLFEAAAATLCSARSIATAQTTNNELHHRRLHDLNKKRFIRKYSFREKENGNIHSSYIFR